MVGYQPFVKMIVKYMANAEVEEKIKVLEKEISSLQQEVNYYNALQLALKLVLNGSYGAFAAKYFVLFNNSVAGTITAEGRQLTKTMSAKNEEYWFELWHKDTELHKKLFIKDVQAIPDDKPVSVYGDSVSGDTLIQTDKYGVIEIEKLWDTYKSSIRKDKEVISVNFKSLNWTEEKKIHYSPVKNLIRHKVSKKKWKLKVGGKEIIVTNDHSMIVFRDGKKIKVKPCEIKRKDKVLIYK
jgi:DNA polymerase elongation subunit (family B)